MQNMILNHALSQFDDVVIPLVRNKRNSVALTGKLNPIIKFRNNYGGYEIDNYCMTFMLVKALYKQKLINEATYSRIMNLYKERSFVREEKHIEWSA